MTELAGIIILGIVAQWLAWKIRIPAILPLILIGLLVGPLSTLWTADGAKLLEPIYKEGQDGIFPDKYLFSFVSLAIGIILFEGGLTLKRREITNVGSVIVKLITIGSITTFIGAGLAAHFIMELSWQISFLFAGLIIVTGPTVIAPILQNVPLNRNVATVLKWEGILIDPIGALVAVLVFEFIRSAGGGMNFTSHALISFFKIILIGMALGASAAYALYQLLRYELIPHYLLNVFTLAFVLGVFVFSDSMEHESGLLSVVVMGMVLGNLDVPRLKEILYFKESLSVLLISILFILLAANIDMDELAIVFRDWRSLALFGVVILILRPLGVFISTNGSELTFNEKLFISWVGPRGIVAAGIASLFGITLVNDGVTGAEYITPLVFMIVLGTVLLNATTARAVSKLLGVTLDASEGILIVGANSASRAVASYLHNEKGRHVVIIDNNEKSVEKVRETGVEAMLINIYNDDIDDKLELLDMGYLIAMTSSTDVNNYALKKYRKIFGENGSFRLITPEELQEPVQSQPDHGIISYSADFIIMTAAIRESETLHEIAFESEENLMQLISNIHAVNNRVPLFITQDDDSRIQMLPKDLSTLELPEGKNFKLVYMGTKLEVVATESKEQE
ncbi:MAG: cation:proton antiporter [Saprospiraceae bacterium]|nr:cation:proton antiporter [Saprospiraceae bacterium]